MEDTRMSSVPTEPPASGANVAQLRAVDAQTEVRLDEDQAPGAAYVDVTSGEERRRPIIPDHWQTWDNAKRHVRLAVARRAHWSAYHGVRLPAYLARSVLFATWGVFVTGGKLIEWWHIPGTGTL